MNGLIRKLAPTPAIRANVWVARATPIVSRLRLSAINRKTSASHVCNRAIAGPTRSAKIESALVCISRAAKPAARWELYVIRANVAKAIAQTRSAETTVAEAAAESATPRPRPFARTQTP